MQLEPMFTEPTELEMQQRINRIRAMLAALPREEWFVLTEVLIEKTNAPASSGCCLQVSHKSYQPYQKSYLDRQAVRLE